MTGREDVRMGRCEDGRMANGKRRRWRVEGWDGMSEGLSSCKAPEDVRRGGWQDGKM